MTDTIGATTGETVLSPYQAGCDPDDENAAWIAAVEARGYVRCSDETCSDGCQGQTFGIVYHSPGYVEAMRAAKDRAAAAWLN
jgi:hypothetical protein